MKVKGTSQQRERNKALKEKYISLFYLEHIL